MNLGNQYTIPFSGLKEGNHEFSFSFDKKFFEEYTVLEAHDGFVSAEVLLEKKLSMLSMQIIMTGNLELKCDRCLDYFTFPLEFRGNLVVKFGKDTHSSTDEIWILDPNEHTINLEQYFFECIGLCLPIQRLHSQNADGISNCNPDMLNILASYDKSEEVGQDLDPRWNKLKELYNDNNN